MKAVLSILLAIILISSCTPKPKAQGELLTAKFTEDEIASGSGTELIIDAKNSGQAEATYKFVISAEGVTEGLVTLDPAGELIFMLRPQETTGEKRIKVTALSNTISTDYEFRVQWQDSEARVLEEKSVILTVSKQIQKTGGGLFGGMKKDSQA